MIKPILILILLLVFGGSFMSSYKVLVRVNESDKGTQISKTDASEISIDEEFVEEERVLASETDSLNQDEMSDGVILATPIVTPTFVPSATPVPTNIPTPTPLPIVKYTNEEIHGFVDQYSLKYGLDANIVRHIINCESRFDQFAVNGGYVGLFQFGSSAWVTARAKMGLDANLDLRSNADESIKTASYLLSEGKSNLWSGCTP